MSTLTKDFEIPVAELQSIGIDVSQLPKETLEALRKGRLTDLMKIKLTNENGVSIETEGRLQISAKEGHSKLWILPVQAKANLQYYRGYHLGPDEQQELALTGRLSHPIECKGQNGKNYPAIIQVDEQTNAVIGFSSYYAYIPEKICGHNFTEEEKNSLRNGKSIEIEGLFKDRTTPEKVFVSFSPVKGSLEFSSPAVMNKRGESMSIDPDKVNIGNSIMGVAITPVDATAIRAGKYVKKTGFSSKDETFDGVVYFDRVTQRVRVSRKDPYDKGLLVDGTKVEQSKKEEKKISEKEEQKEGKTKKMKM